jgi:hypothetical protein
MRSPLAPWLSWLRWAAGSELVEIPPYLLFGQARQARLGRQSLEQYLLLLRRQSAEQFLLLSGR